MELAISRKVKVGVLALGLVGTLAFTSANDAPAAKKGAFAFVEMVNGPTGPEFTQTSDTIPSDQSLAIRNLTKPNKFGPHFFTLAEKSDIPNTKAEFNKCDKLKGICGKLVKAHDIRLKDFKVREQLATKGVDGWDTLFSDNARGDSWYSETKGEEFGQGISAEAGTTLNYFCVIHAPKMKGSIDVVEP